MTNFNRKFTKAMDDRAERELAIGFIRYEAVRVLTPRRFAALNKLTMQGHHFDNLVDCLIEEGHGFLDEVVQ